MIPPHSLKIERKDQKETLGFLYSFKDLETISY